MDSLGDVTPYVADALVVLGVFVMTAGVYGLATMPDIYTKIHAASKAVFLGAIALLVASFASGDTSVIFRAILIIAALLITTPIASHTIAKAAAERGDRMRTPGAINESGYDLNKVDIPSPTETGEERLRTFLGE